MPLRSSRGSSLKAAKAARDTLLAKARGGDLSARADALAAFRVRIARVAAGSVRPEIEPTVEEECGALLEAEMAHDIHALLLAHQSSK